MVLLRLGSADVDFVDSRHDWPPGRRKKILEADSCWSQLDYRGGVYWEARRLRRL
jgi:hypothetical protein